MLLVGPRGGGDSSLDTKIMCVGDYEINSRIHKMFLRKSNVYGRKWKHVFKLSFSI